MNNTQKFKPIRCGNVKYHVVWIPQILAQEIVRAIRRELGPMLVS